MKITANRLTFLRIILLPLPCLLLYGGPGAKLAALGMGSLLGLTDYFDGKLARRQGVTRLGAFLDPIADKIFVSTLYFYLARLGFLPLWLVGVILLREFLVSSLRPKVSGNLPVVWLAKVKTTIQMLGAALLVAIGAFPEWAFYFFLFAAGIIWLGIFLSKLPFSKAVFLGIMALVLPLVGHLPAEKAAFVLGLGLFLITWLSATSYLQKAFHSLRLREGFEVFLEVLLPLLALLGSAKLKGLLGLLPPAVLVLFFLRAALLLIKPASFSQLAIFLLGVSGLLALVFPSFLAPWMLLLGVYFMAEVFALFKGRWQLLA